MPSHTDTYSFGRTTVSVHETSEYQRGSSSGRKFEPSSTACYKCNEYATKPASSKQAATGQEQLPEVTEQQKTLLERMSKM